MGNEKFSQGNDETSLGSQGLFGVKENISLGSGNISQGKGKFSQVNADTVWVEK